MEDPFRQAKWTTATTGMIVLAAVSPALALALGAAVRLFLWAAGL